MMAKSGKMQHKQMMANNGTSFYLNWPKVSETANKVVNVLFEKLSATYIIYYLQKEETIYPSSLNCQEVKL